MMLSHRVITNTLTLFAKNIKTSKNPSVLHNLGDKNTPVCTSLVHRYSTDIHPSSNVRDSFQEVIEDDIEEERTKSKEIIKKVNDHIAEGSHGRLFAVIYILGKQYKVTTEDLLVLERNWAPKVRDNIRFEKVMLVGSANFTLIGSPVLPRNIVNVTGTIVNKDLTYTKFRYYRIAKERVKNLNFVQEELTFLRINKIEVYPQVNELTHTEYLRSF